AEGALPILGRREEGCAILAAEHHEGGAVDVVALERTRCASAQNSRRGESSFDARQLEQIAQHEISTARTRSELQGRELPTVAILDVFEHPAVKPSRFLLDRCVEPLAENFADQPFCGGIPRGG